MPSEINLGPLADSVHMANFKADNPGGTIVRIDESEETSGLYEVRVALTRGGYMTHEIDHEGHIMNRDVKKR